MTYNKTQLHPDVVLKHQVYKRDHLAHYLRWVHVVERVKPYESTILDIGCGTASLYSSMYHNAKIPKEYLGIDIRERTINELYHVWAHRAEAHFLCRDIVTMSTTDLVMPYPGWSMITCFEVLEHIGKKNAPIVLDKIRSLMDVNTKLFVSSPCYDPDVGAADNHMIDGEVGEHTYAEMEKMLSERFIIEDRWGTFASMKDYKAAMDSETSILFDRLRSYYPPDIMAVLMAPLFPTRSRNVLWQCRRP